MPKNIDNVPFGEPNDHLWMLSDLHARSDNPEVKELIQIVMDVVLYILDVDIVTEEEPTEPQTADDIPF